MLVDSIRRNTIKVNKRKSLFEKCVEKNQEDDLSRYTMSKDLKDKIHNIIASQNSQYNNLKH